MSKKKGAETTVAFQTECETGAQWAALCKRQGLTVVDVFTGWIGPCVSMINILKRIKAEANDDRLHFATACSDRIEILHKFRDQSEPCWLFLATGVPVRVLRGCHVPNLARAIRDELDHEILCLEGSAERSPINISDTQKPKSEGDNEMEGDEETEGEETEGEEMQTDRVTSPDKPIEKDAADLAPLSGTEGAETDEGEEEAL